MATNYIKNLQPNTLPSRAQTLRAYEGARQSYLLAQSKLRRKIKSILEKENINASIRVRMKSFDSFYNKLLRFYNQGRRENLEITDMIGIRIVCSFLGELEHVKTLLSKNFHVLELESKGAQHTYREFGYDSIHMLVQIPNELIKEPIPHTQKVCEIQLRTKLQDAWAEVEHELIYKSDYSLLNDALKRKLAALNASLTLTDIIFQEIRDYQTDRRAKDERRRHTVQSKMESIAPLSNVENFPVADPKKTEGAQPESDIQEVKLDKLLLKALDAHSQQKFDAALHFYTHILNLNPDKRVASIVHNHRGMVYFVLSDYEKAEYDFSKAIEFNSKYERAFNNRGLALRMLGNMDKALEDFQQAVKLDARQIDSYVGLAQINVEMGNFAAAIEHCEKVLNIKPNYKPALNLKKHIMSKIFQG